MSQPSCVVYVLDEHGYREESCFSDPKKAVEHLKSVPFDDGVVICNNSVVASKVGGRIFRGFPKGYSAALLWSPSRGISLFEVDREFSTVSLGFGSGILSGEEPLCRVEYDWEEDKVFIVTPIGTGVLQGTDNINDMLDEMEKWLRDSVPISLMEGWA